MALVQKGKVLIVVDDMVGDIIANNNLNPADTEISLRGRKINISLCFLSQSYFKVPKTMRINVTHCFIMKIPHKVDFQQVGSNHSSDIGFKDFMKLYKDYTKKPYSFLVNDTTNQIISLRLSRNLL